MKYVDNGYMFMLNKPSANRTKLFWRCDKEINHCKVRLHINTQTGQVYSCSIEECKW